jgi:hypothetical protein
MRASHRKLINNNTSSLGGQSPSITASGQTRRRRSQRAAQAIVSWITPQGAAATTPPTPHSAAPSRSRSAAAASFATASTAGGDGGLNRALHDILLARWRSCPRTRDCITRWQAEGETDAQIRRCLKRYIARELHRSLTSQWWLNKQRSVGRLGFESLPAGASHLSQAGAGFRLPEAASNSRRGGISHTGLTTTQQEPRQRAAGVDERVGEGGADSQ